MVVIHRRTLVATALATPLLARSGLAATSGPGGFPARPVRFVVPFPPGGTTDLVARVLAAALTERLGQNVVVENKPGASGAIGTEAVARARPDGYTLVIATINTHGINSAVFKNLPYDAVADFTPISELVTSPNVMTANPGFGARSVADVIRMAKEQPGQIAFGSTGHGGSPHMSGVLLQTMAGISLKHVPYKGGGPMLNDLIAGHIPLAFDNLPSSAEQIRSGAVRGLAVTTLARAPSVPDVPTMAETLPGYDVPAWFGLLGPAKMPAALAAFLSAEIAAVLKDATVRQRLEDSGATPVGSTPDAFAAVVRAEVERWQHVGEVASIRIE